VVRVVLDLKSEVKPQIFYASRRSVNYGHRLVLDIYPIEPVDPILALAAKARAQDRPGIFGTPDEEKPEGSASIKRPQPAVPADRLVTIAVDAGHGGRIRAPGTPRARGRNTSP